MKIVVKVGTNSILSDEGYPQESLMRSLVNQIVSLQKSGHHLVLVSSGAVGFGRHIARQSLGKEYGSSIGEKQVLASLGQHELMHIYSKLFKEQGLLCSQLLLTRQDFYTRKHYLNISRLVTEILNHRNIIPIVNENDTVAVEELMFTDNDELAGLIAAQMNADKLIVLSNVDGVYSGDPADPASSLISKIDPDQTWPSITPILSKHGRGGMLSKLSTAKKMAKLGIKTHIASVNVPNIICALAENAEVGTQILACKHKSNIKKWVAYSTHQKTGRIMINDRLYAVIQENKHILSILPVGIQSFEGIFKKGDIVEIIEPGGQAIGIGIAKYDSHTLTHYVGQKNKPHFIHYDHLYIY